MYKAVIFDLDGTLLDTLNDIVHVLNATLARFSLAPVTNRQAAQYIGNGARELVRLAVGGENAERLDEILAAYRSAYAEDDGSHSALYDGEEETLASLRRRGISLAVLTNKPHDVALKTDRLFFGKDTFAFVQGQEAGLPLKPAPDGVFRILSALGVKADECLFVGDGETDVLTARNAGMDCVSVLWGYRTKEQLSAVGAKTFARNFGELENYILGV